MICNDALELLLDADLDELEGKGGSPLAAHVRSCARCRTVAAQLGLDTRALGRTIVERPSAAPVRRVRRPIVHRPVFVAGALAAGLLLAVLAVRRDGATPRIAETATSSPAVGSRGARASAATAPPSAPVVARSPRVRGSKPASGARVVLGTPVRARRFAEPPSATPVQLVASHSVAVGMRAASDSNQVAVTAPAGIRIALLKTGNPGITVVWLY
jgi:hypothetical protein